MTSRRSLLKGGIAGAFAAAASGGAFGPLGLGSLAQPAFAAELSKKKRQVLFIWLDGGISQLESWDPKPGTQFGGPFRSIPTTIPGVRFSELLPHSAKQAHRLSIVRGMHTKDDAHSSGVLRIERGDPKNRGVQYPYLGAAVTHFLGSANPKLPPYVWIKPYSGGFKHQDGGFLGARYGCLALGDGKPPENLLRNPAIPADVDAARNQLRRKANERFARGRSTAENDANTYAYDMAAQLMSRQELFDDSQYSKRDIERYGRHDLGRHILQAKHLIQAGVTFVKVTSYHWDTHGDNFNLSQCLVPQFDQPFAALIEDLHASGMAENVLVIAMSEFGRTPRINGHVGRDHWPEAWSVAMSGCGLQQGAVIGKTNDKGTWVTEDEVDVGHLFHTWFRAIGVDTTKIEYDNHGQPLPVANEETKAIEKILT
ncbi:DUF1501 domain-containing protein [Humisphaera borealis]|uniref:DUF1501 domain-containing protein n=1 Tax=Humisphaera borealis TaxID=2807512 RepID=A0A7M2X5R0_9BACT|nr:DUF1501 domain-containing protein [Humisphaera borealis]